MDKLTPRQRTILGLVVREYVKSASPVSSRALVEHYGIQVSTATVRNELALLEELGYLTHPHTSAARVPTHKGYNHFVERLLGEAELPLQEQRTIAHQFHQVRPDFEQWMPLAASVLLVPPAGPPWSPRHELPRHVTNTCNSSLPKDDRCCSCSSCTEGW